jgi:hypothetical protein
MMVKIGPKFNYKGNDCNFPIGLGLRAWQRLADHDKLRIARGKTCWNLHEYRIPCFFVTDDA